MICTRCISVHLNVIEARRAIVVIVRGIERWGKTSKRMGKLQQAKDELQRAEQWAARHESECEVLVA